MTRVLIVDDEIDVCESIARVLERSGYECVTVLDAESALRRCSEERFSVVITDIVMPNQHGVDLIKQLRAEFPRIGIIAVSGGGNVAIAGYQPDAIKTSAYLAAAVAAGADRCLTKPFERADLLECVAALA